MSGFSGAKSHSLDQHQMTLQLATVEAARAACATQPDAALLMDALGIDPALGRERTRHHADGRDERVWAL